MKPTLPQTTKEAKQSTETVRYSHVIEKTLNSNKNSDYTEQIEALGKAFEYEQNAAMYWGEAEFSMLYGTPIYEQATEDQKRALNHLYWVGQYHHTSSAEANTMLYNQVTAGVFSTFDNYQSLCDELELETDQERYHIKAAQRIGLKTKVALLGKEALKRSVNGLPNVKSPRQSFPKFGSRLKVGNHEKSLQDSLLRSVSRTIFSKYHQHYSPFLAEREANSVPTVTGGLAGYTANPTIFKFLTLNWGSSPFMACQYYSMRMVANMSLKAYEYQYYKRYKELNKVGAKIPIPTAFSHYHLLDEAFHTTMSRVIAQDIYKDFPEPTPYEKLLSNLIVLRGQQGITGGLSGWLPATFRHDADYIPSLYRLLRSRLFNLSPADSLHWMEKCLCQEHEGFYVNLKLHDKLLTAFQSFFGQLEYLWPVNREMKIMAASASISTAIRSNKRAFNKFAATVV